MEMGVLAYTGPFLFLASIPLLYMRSAAAPLLTPALVLLTLLACEGLGRGKQHASDSSPLFRVLPVLYIPMQLLVTVWAAHEAARTDSVPAFVSLALAVGVCMGVFGVLAAHEMVHSRTRWHQALGGLLLTGMTYRHFRIAHVYGHHRFAATDLDPSTARLGENFYAFFARTLWEQPRLAYRFEKRRCRGRPMSLLRNCIAQDAVISCGAYVFLALGWGMRAAVFLALESAIAILVLELFNYVAHYGLSRHTANGKVERFADRHSWNSSGLGNFLIFNMGRHSHHHRAPSISYEGLKAATAPELPYGYSGSIVLALIPPFWRAVMDRRAREACWRAHEMGYTAGVEISLTVL